MFEAFFNLLAETAASISEALVGRAPRLSRYTWLDFAIRLAVGIVLALVLLAALIFLVFWLIPRVLLSI